MKRWSLFKKIEQDALHHITEYILLVLTAMIYVALMSALRGDHTKQYIITGCFVVYYIVWGIIHHSRDQSLHLKVVLEYILIGALALLLLRPLLI